MLTFPPYVLLLPRNVGVKLNVSLYLSFIEHRTKHMRGRVEFKHNSLLTCVPYRAECFAHLRNFTPGERTPGTLCVAVTVSPSVLLDVFASAQNHIPYPRPSNP